MKDPGGFQIKHGMKLSGILQPVVELGKAIEGILDMVNTSGIGDWLRICAEVLSYSERRGQLRTPGGLRWIVNRGSEGAAGA